MGSFGIRMMPPHVLNSVLGGPIKQNTNSRFTKMVKMAGELKPTKNPVIFVHGLFGFGELNVWSFIRLRYWRGIEEALWERY